MSSSHTNGSGGRGSYYDPQPIDFLLLSKMPQRGLIGGLHWKGRQVKDLLAEVIQKDLEGDNSEAQLDTNYVSARIRSMHYGGKVEGHPGKASGTYVWSRTPQGDELLANKDKYLGGVS